MLERAVLRILFLMVGFGIFIYIYIYNKISWVWYPGIKTKFMYVLCVSLHIVLCNILNTHIVLGVTSHMKSDVKSCACGGSTKEVSDSGSSGF